MVDGTVVNRPLEKEINIYVGMTEMQRKWYRSVLEKDIDAVNGMSFILFLLGSVSERNTALQA